jgi:hypothetical protein
MKQLLQKASRGDYVWGFVQDSTLKRNGETFHEFLGTLSYEPPNMFCPRRGPQTMEPWFGTKFDRLEYTILKDGDGDIPQSIPQSQIVNVLDDQENALTTRHLPRKGERVTYTKDDDDATQHIGTIQSIKKTIWSPGFCTLWSLLFMYMQVANPTLSPQHIMTLMNRDPNKLGVIVRAWLTYLSDTKGKLFELVSSN